MSDDADRADQRITDTIEDGVAASRRALGNSLAACGCCHYCESPVRAGMVFCNKTCLDDWQHEQDRKKALGL